MSELRIARSQDDVRAELRSELLLQRGLNVDFGEHAEALLFERLFDASPDLRERLAHQLRGEAVGGCIVSVRLRNHDRPPRASERPPRPASLRLVRDLLILLAATASLRRRHAGEHLLDVHAAAGIRRLPTRGTLHLSAHRALPSSQPADCSRARCSAISRRTSSMSMALARVISSSSARAGTMPACAKSRIPSRNSINVGIARIWSCPPSCGSASVFTFANTTSGCRLEAASYAGAKARHGPHHGAHQSTRTMPFSTV